MAPLDPHSYTDDQQPLTDSIDLAFSISFEDRIIAGTVQLHLKSPAAGLLDLDTRDLKIEKVVDRDGKDVQWSLDDPQPVLGSRLRLALSSDVVTISFRTSQTASAIQWLEPSQTAGDKQPYVFTQCQPIHARSIFPCQDTPTARVRYTAVVTMPLSTRAVMSAKKVDREERGGDAVEKFVMEQPIPPYLFALAAGDIVHAELGPRSCIYAEPAVIDSAAFEFANTEAIIAQAEALFGSYEWERFDMLVMPPSFPYGGMENPRMTFLTPTLITGDRSLVEVVYHELAHSWTGNLVTNATMNDFWLNEGFTMYAERRIVEKMEGSEKLALHEALGWNSLLEEIESRFADRPQFTRLRTDLEGVDPDDVFGVVPYEKGYLFLKRVEQAVGRPAFDNFLRNYIDTFRFSSITTATFLSFICKQFPNIKKEVDLEAWVNQPGLPADAPKPRSERLDQINAVAVKLAATGKGPTKEETQSWQAREWQVFLDALPKELPTNSIQNLDDTFSFSKSKNMEICVSFLTIAAYSGYEPLLPTISDVLHKVGRMKYLRPLYSGLCKGGSKVFAHQVLASAKPKYHPVAQSIITEIVFPSM